MPAELYEFLYLDDELTAQFVAQLEGGVVQQEVLRGGSERNRELRGQLGASGANASASARRTTEDRHEQTLARSPESNFRKLVGLIGELGDVPSFSTESVANWSDIVRRSIVTVDGEVSIPSAVSALANFADVEQLMSLMEATGNRVSEEDAAIVNQIRSIKGLLGEDSVAVVDIGPRGYKFVCRLAPRFLRVPLSEVQGEVTIVAKVLEKITEGNVYPLVAVPGLNLLPREQRREAERQMHESSQAGDSVMTIEGPAVSLSPIAIYR